MAIYPDVQKKAQDELDTVLGNNTMPRLSDRLQLPYVEAIVREVNRWHPVAPQGRRSIFWQMIVTFLPSSFSIIPPSSL
jgi:cytochrome P450